MVVPVAYALMRQDWPQKLGWEALLGEPTNALQRHGLAARHALLPEGLDYVARHKGRRPQAVCVRVRTPL